MESFRRLSSREKSCCNRATVLLHHVISEQEWDFANRLLKDATKYKRSLRTSDTIASDFIIHHACRMNAPLLTIVRLSAMYPMNLNTADDDGRYPLHLAVASGCTPDVIRFFVRNNPSSAEVQDKFGKTPLHYAGECYAENFIRNRLGFPDFNEVHSNTFLVVEMLVDVAPQSTNLEDEDEMNPIEYALVSATNIKTIKVMQRASRKEWRKQAESIRHPVQSTVAAITA